MNFDTTFVLNMLTAVLLIVVAVVLYVNYGFKRKANIKGKHVLISGGSKGIGLEVAAQCFQQGAKVTILARDENGLKEAKKYICSKSEEKRDSEVIYFPVNVSKDYELLETIIQKAEDELGPIYGLFNIVGKAVCYRFLETPLNDFDDMIKVNYQSTVNCTRAVLKKMVTRNEGFIEITSSMAGLFGIYGFSAYSASKFALLGFAQTLAMEMKPHNISITITYPPDTDTPGFALENTTKPEETKLICESGGLLPPSKVARSIINDTLKGKFSSTVTFEGFILRTLTSGLSPPNGIFAVLLEANLMGPLRLVGLLILTHFNKIVRDCFKKRVHTKSE
ncbi:3-ketodihydrosphingosine reductase [Tetranychus urticae]|uniref:3-dehydrosphinganine reductase n=1 Tax=Tetranychus urticae TaxID=32264 RepID=T1KMJ1_TETUR|nr:3-ketodihydrosphingosine reductase [Tetranychus urticae]